MFKVDDNKVIDNGGSDKANKSIVNSSQSNKFRNLIYMPNIGIAKKSTFLIPNAKKAFNYLNQAFIKALIL